MIAVGTKKGNRYSRALSSFNSPIEVGLAIPIDDYKYLSSYKVVTLTSVAVKTDTTLQVSDPTNIPLNYVTGLDGLIIKNGVVGPSTVSDSKGLKQIRPIKRGSNTIIIDKDESNNADTLRMNMNVGDNIICSRTPRGYDWLSSIESGFGSAAISEPQMINVKKHTNSLFLNLPQNENSTLLFPITGNELINNNSILRFSFYYRSYGTTHCITTVEYYTSNDSFISSYNYPNTTELSGVDASGESDFRYYSIVIPSLNDPMPPNTKKIRIKLLMTTYGLGGSKLEIAYPVLETDNNIGATAGALFFPNPPSNFTYSKKYQNKLSESVVRTIVPSLKSKLFFSHVGRNTYSVKLNFSLISGAFLRQLMVLENYNQMGYLVSIRLQHPDVPPVMIGNININTSHINWDYTDTDISLDFEELL